MFDVLKFSILIAMKTLKDEDCKRLCCSLTYALNSKCLRLTIVTLGPRPPPGEHQVLHLGVPLRLLRNAILRLGSTYAYDHT